MLDEVFFSVRCSLGSRALLVLAGRSNRAVWARATREILKHQFPDRMVSCCGDLNWLARSPDFFLSRLPQTLQVLKTNIEEEITNLDLNILQFNNSKRHKTSTNVHQLRTWSFDRYYFVNLMSSIWHLQVNFPWKVSPIFVISNKMAANSHYDITSTPPYIRILVITLAISSSVGILKSVTLCVSALVSRSISTLLVFRLFAFFCFHQIYLNFLLWSLIMTLKLWLVH